MRRRTAVPLLSAAASAGSGALVWLTPAGSPERVIGALLLVLVLPGAALSRLLSWPERHGPGGRTLLIPALSLSLVVVDSLILYLIGIRLDTHSWTISLGAIAVVASAAGPLRAVPLPQLRLARHRLRALGPVWLGAGGVAILLVGAALITVNGVRAQTRADHFTQLWILPHADNERAATIGVFNHEDSRKSYQVKVDVNGRAWSSWTVRLRPSSRWSTSVHFAPNARSVRVTLSLTSSPGVTYREVHLRLAPTGLASIPSLLNKVP